MPVNLPSLLRPAPHALDAHDVLASFLRLARGKWGERMPLEPVRFTRDVLTVRCPSPLWRTELLFSAGDLRDALLRDLPLLTLRRISAVLV